MLLHKKHTHEADPGPVLKMAVFSNKISKRKKKKSNSTAINWERVLNKALVFFYVCVFCFLSLNFSFLFRAVPVAHGSS